MSCGTIGPSVSPDLQALLDERAGVLLGRERQQAALRDLVTEERPLVAFVHGIAGVGKSSLLRWLAREAGAIGATVVALDGRDVEPTEPGLRAAVEGRIPLDGCGRVLLVVDTYELLRMLDPWIRRSFVPALPDAVRVVLAGREPPSLAWRREYGELLRVVRLENLAPGDAETVLARAGVGDEEARRVNRVVRGHPLSLLLAGTALRDRSAASLERAATGAVVEEFARTYLDVLDQPTRRALQAASVTRRTTLSLLDAILPDEPATDAFARLRELPFVELGREGLIVHDTVRQAAALELKAADPVAYRAYRAAAWRCLRREMRGAARHEMWRYTADMLYLIEDEAVRENFFPSTPLEHDVTPAEPADWPAVAQLAQPADAELVREWWKGAPSAFSVARDPEGNVAGFRAACQPAEVSPRLLDRDPVASAWRAHLRSDPVPRGQRVVFARFVARVEIRSGFDGALAALLLDLKRLYVSLRPDLRRIYALEIPGIGRYCAMTLGYQPVPGLPDTAFNDLGPASIDGWLAGLGAREFLDEADPLDVDERRLRVGDEPVSLTPLEANVLAYLRAHEDRAVPREALLRDVWGHEWTGGSNVVDVTVSALRKKLGEHAPSLETVRGVGYRLRALS
jgi:hypothetical protein